LCVGNVLCVAAAAAQDLVEDVAAGAECVRGGGGWWCWHSSAGCVRGGGEWWCWSVSVNASGP